MENLSENIAGGVLTVTTLSLLLLKVFATEWVTQVAQHLFKSTSKKRTGKILNWTIVIFFLVSALAFISPLLSRSNEKPVSYINEEPKKKTREEVNADLIKFGVNKSVDEGGKYFENRKEKQNREDSIYQANRPHRWVYQVGDLMDNDQSIFNLYEKLKSTENICLFKDKDKYFFFKNEQLALEPSDDSLEAFKAKIGISIVNKVDLMKYSNNSKEILIETDSKRIGRRRDRIKIECFTIYK